MGRWRVGRSDQFRSGAQRAVESRQMHLGKRFSTCRCGDEMMYEQMRKKGEGTATQRADRSGEQRC